MFPISFRRACRAAALRLHQTARGFAAADRASRAAAIEPLEDRKLLSTVVMSLNGDAGPEGQPRTAGVYAYAIPDTGEPDQAITAFDVTWGDGATTHTGAVVNYAGDWFPDQTLTHVYANVGTYQVSVTATAADGDSTTQTADMAIEDAPIHVTGGDTIYTITGLEVTNAKVAAFTDDDPTATDPGKYTATIDWGDNTTSSGTITWNATDSRFEVAGTHTYQQDGSYNVVVTVNDNDGQSDYGELGANSAPPTLDSMTVTNQAHSDETITLSNGLYNGLLDLTADSGGISTVTVTGSVNPASQAHRAVYALFADGTKVSDIAGSATLDWNAHDGYTIEGGIDMNDNGILDDGDTVVRTLQAQHTKNYIDSTTASVTFTLPTTASKTVNAKEYNKNGNVVTGPTLTNTKAVYQGTNTNAPVTITAAANLTTGGWDFTITLTAGAAKGDTYTFTVKDAAGGVTPYTFTINVN